MAMRYFNWKLAIVLVVAAAVFAVAAISLHRWQTEHSGPNRRFRGV